MYRFFTDDELDDFDEMFNEATKETEVPVKGIDWKEAYGLNKTRKTCILCGKSTVEKALLSSVIRFCKCVDELAKKNK